MPGPHPVQLDAVDAPAVDENFPASQFVQVDSDDSPVFRI